MFYGPGLARSMQDMQGVSVVAIVKGGQEENMSWRKAHRYFQGKPPSYAFVKSCPSSRSPTKSSICVLRVPVGSLAST